MGPILSQNSASVRCYKALNRYLRLTVYLTGPLCPIGPIGWNSAVDQLNGAQSGALASNLYHEVVDYLIPQVKKRGIPTTKFKYLSMQIGSNDICQLCAQANIGIGIGSANDFEYNIRRTLEAIRKGIRAYLSQLVESRHS